LLAATLIDNLAPHDGPNGFVRTFKGRVVDEQVANLQVQAKYENEKKGLTLKIHNWAAQVAKVQVRDAYTGALIENTLKPGEAFAKHWSLSSSAGWYDYVISVEGDESFEYPFAGHVETGLDGISDPAMGLARED
jgi:phospholipase C